VGPEAVTPVEEREFGWPATVVTLDDKLSVIRNGLQDLLERAYEDYFTMSCCY